MRKTLTKRSGSPGISQSITQSGRCIGFRPVCGVEGRRAVHVHVARSHLVMVCMWLMALTRRSQLMIAVRPCLANFIPCYVVIHT